MQLGDEFEVVVYPLAIADRLSNDEREPLGSDRRSVACLKLTDPSCGKQRESLIRQSSSVRQTGVSAARRSAA